MLQFLGAIVKLKNIPMEKLICKKQNTLFNALRIINANAKGIIFIVDEADKLCGVVTDGDIRRFLLNGGEIHSELSEILKDDFVYARIGENKEQILAKINNRIKIIPIVDEEFKLVDFVEDRREINLPIAVPDLKGNELKYLIDAFLSTRISNSGEYVDKFENGFAEFSQCRYGIAVSNGTVALHLAFTALGIGKGDEVIVPDLTFAATINAVLHTGSTPVIVDVEKDSWCIDPKEIKKAITTKTKAILPVHLYGQPCDMDAIMAIAKKKNLFVVEDCAEAHGARYDTKKVGSFGNIGCFSFYGNKIITTGEGGMCITNSEELNQKMRVLRDHGMSKERKYWHDTIGYNYRMTNLQASVGVAQLERIEEILNERKKIEEEYRKHLSNIDILEFQKNNLPKREKITWLVSALIKNNKRDYYITKLRDKGIDARNFFYPLSEMTIYKNFIFSRTNSINISKNWINFPTHYNILHKTTFENIKKILTND